MDLLLKIETLLSENSLPQAKNLLDEYLKENDTLSPKLHYLIALYHIRSLAYDLAIPHLMKVEEDGTSSIYLPRTYKLLAYCFLMQKDYDRGESILLDYISNYPTDPATKNMLAYCFYAKQEIEKAKLLYEEVLGEDPDNITAKNGLACILTDYENNPSKALEILKEKGNLSKDPRILDTLGWIHLKMGEKEKAESYLKEALDILPTHPEINQHMAYLMLES